MQRNNEVFLKVSERRKYHFLFKSNISVKPKKMPFALLTLKSSLYKSEPVKIYPEFHTLEVKTFSFGKKPKLYSIGSSLNRPQIYAQFIVKGYSTLTDFYIKSIRSHYFMFSHLTCTHDSIDNCFSYIKL